MCFFSLCNVFDPLDHRHLQNKLIKFNSSIVPVEKERLFNRQLFVWRRLYFVCVPEPDAALEIAAWELAEVGALTSPSFILNAASPPPPRCMWDKFRAKVDLSGRAWADLRRDMSEFCSAERERDYRRTNAHTSTRAFCLSPAIKGGECDDMYPKPAGCP